jgi:NADH-quinone oxidoreductase subunit C
MPTAETLQRVSERFGADTFAVTTFRDDTRLLCPPSRISELLQFLRSEAGFDLLVDITAVDYSEYGDAQDRYGVIYCMANTTTAERLVVRVPLNDPDPTLPSAVGIWSGANWLEREVFDMFGIRFDGHPDLRRILLPEEFAAFPLRKDYPLRGRGERHNFPVLTRAES